MHKLDLEILMESELKNIGFNGDWRYDLELPLFSKLEMESHYWAELA